MPRNRKRKKIYDPRVWPAWIAVGLAWLIARLPLRLINWIGHALGGLVYLFGRSRRHITHTNLALCFPELSESERLSLARESFTHTALGALEATVAWLNPARDLAARTEIIGLEHLERARAQGRGVLLLGGHFSAMDVISPKMAAIDFDVIYRQNKNPVWEWLQVNGRQRYFDGIIERNDTRQILRRLKAGRAIWYAADQDYGARHSVFAPFFGVSTASITATARLARFNNSPVLLMSNFRNPDTLTWTVRIGEALEGYPTGDDVADATRINQIIEQAIRTHPEQYLWMHRRFKTRPPGRLSLY